MVKKDIRKVGNRPERYIYSITEKGKEEFNKLLKETYDEIERHYYKLDAGLIFMKFLDKNEVLKKLNMRKKIIKEKIIPHLESQDKRLRGTVPIHEIAILDHALYHTKAELSWLSKLIKDIEKETNI